MDGQPSIRLEGRTPGCSMMALAFVASPLTSCQCRSPTAAPSAFKPQRSPSQSGRCRRASCTKGRLGYAFLVLRSKIVHFIALYWCVAFDVICSNSSKVQRQASHPCKASLARYLLRSSLKLPAFGAFTEALIRNDSYKSPVIRLRWYLTMLLPYSSLEEP